MGEATNPPASSGPVIHHRASLAFQLSLFGLLAATVWNLTAQEAPTSFEHRMRLTVVSLAACLSMGFWFEGCAWRLPLKLGCIGAGLMTMLVIGIQSAQSYDAASGILLPARIDRGRIVHQGLGLSYSIPPNFRVQLRPRFLGGDSSQSAGESKFPSRLQHGDMAILCQLVEISGSMDRAYNPAWILLEVQRDKVANWNVFIRDVRGQQAKWAAVPNVKIVRPTHVFDIGGLEMVEFEFVKEPQHLLARQVFLRAGPCIVNLMLNSSRESDQVIFDEFLRSIRVERN